MNNDADESRYINYKIENNSIVGKNDNNVGDLLDASILDASKASGIYACIYIDLDTLCVFVYVFMIVCLYIYVCLYTYVYIYICIYIFIYLKSDASRGRAYSDGDK
jgi:hypothetical protein